MKPRTITLKTPRHDEERAHEGNAIRILLKAGMLICNLKASCWTSYGDSRMGRAVCSRGVLVHRPSRLGAAVTVLAAEIPRCDGVLTNRALERAEAVHNRDGVMSHSFIIVLLSRCDCELKTTRWRWESEVSAFESN